MLDNHLVENLPPTVDLRRRLRPFSFAIGDILAEPNTPIDRIIFPRSGLISIVVELDGGHQIEAGTVGRRGALGGVAILGAKHHLHAATGQIPGTAWSLGVVEAKELAGISPEFRQLIVAQEQYMLAQARQFAACNARHVLMQRLCSWLSRLREESASGELSMTQDTLAKMLGVQRASVSMLAGQLQEEELISYRRGRIRVVDPERLKERACPCHETLEKHYQRLFGGQQNRADSRPSDGHRVTDQPSLS